ncbi:hypothetical protein [Methylobacterium sp. Leaf466]|uniref:hypothetical protein n=1 Tax=Methylobacterium sp. Leaf466 TaxID=1736386 RepID=UPI0006FE558A|nr:hypothetical protein [Methylobacterium sp. Leaf466]KQT84307.1 hypothetical protein ASG59_02655 [Methylobacterium sp. Leaf466]
MSEAARQYPSQEAPARQAPGPLRDWLTAMKAATALPAEAAAEPAPQQAASSWSPRVVTPPPPAQPASEARPTASPDVEGDVADLMAENMMLKAKLRIEEDRYKDLQSILAQELRDLRAHIDSEMDELNEIRAERDLWMARAETLAQPLFQKR